MCVGGSFGDVCWVKRIDGDFVLDGEKSPTDDYYLLPMLAFLSELLEAVV